VIARNTAFTFKGKPVDVKRLGRDLNIRYVLEGSVQRSVNRLRVNLQLVDAQTANHLWGPVVDLFDTQDEIVSRIVNMLDAELIAVEARRAERSSHPDAMDLCFRGVACLHRGVTKEHLAQARSFFERVLALDSQNVQALVSVVSVDLTMGIDLFSDDRAASCWAAEAALIKAMSVAPRYAAARPQSLRITKGLVEEICREYNFYGLFVRYEGQFAFLESGPEPKPSNVIQFPKPFCSR
jgi:hypothetical protein